MFALDSIQVRASRPAEGQAPVLAGAVLAELKHLSSFLAFLLLGAGGWSTASRMQTAGPASAPGVFIPSQGRGRPSKPATDPGA